MPARIGPRADQISIIGANPDQVLTAGFSFASFEDAQGGPGGGTGLVSATTALSRDIVFTQEVSGTSLPPAGVFGEFNTSVYQDGADQGEKLEFSIPDDYDSGDVELLVTHRMSTAEVADLTVQVDISIVEIVTGMTIVNTGPTIASFMPANSTDVQRAILLTIDSANVAAGNVIVVNITRLGASSPTTDLHTGDFEVLRWSYRYTGRTPAAAGSVVADVFLMTDEPIPTNGFVGEIPVTDYPTGSDVEQKTIFTIPEEWDGTSDVHFTATYFTSVAEAGGEIQLDTEGEIANIVDNTVDIVGVSSFGLVPSNTTGPQRSVSFRTLPAASLHPGDVVALKLARRTGGTGNHTGDFRLVNVTMVLTQTNPGSGASATTTYSHLATGVYDIVSGLASGDTDAPTLLGDFQSWDRLSNASPGASEIHVSYEGRVSPDDTQISSIDIPIKGTGQYNIKIYVEDATTSNPVFESGLASAPASRNVVNLTDANLSAQPGSEKRYFVVIEATLDPGEDVFVGLPYVGHD